ncbi:MAG: UrvD/REP family ATP-dependent DNA helicase [Candidatus Humimicrobiaceae bacterium]
MPLKSNYRNIFKNISEKNNNYFITGPPGTGKSYCLTNLIAYLITEKNIEPEKILVFTFNRKTSKYYREEIARLINKSVGETPILTFYSFCLEFISSCRANNALKSSVTNCLETKGNFCNQSYEEIFNKQTGEIKLMTAPQQWELVTCILENLDSKKYFKVNRLLRSNKFIRVNIIQEIFDYILRARENLLSPRYLSKKFTPYVNDLMFEINNIYREYEARIRENDFYDYGRILQETTDILKNEAAFTDNYKQKYEFMFVDDVQEISYAGFEIIKNISNNNVVFFGNDDESIYGFRGSNINNYFRIYHNMLPCNIINLDINFRNSYLINEVSNNFIARNKSRINKTSRVLGLDKNKGEAIAGTFINLHEELNFILERINYLFRVKNIKLKDMAIILKGSEYEIKIIENYFIQNNVTYYLRNSRSVYGSKYVKYFLNICRLCISINDLNKKPGMLLNSKTFRSGFSTPDRIDLLIRNLLFSEAFSINPLFFKKIESVYLSGLPKGNYKNIWEFLLENLKDFKNISSKADYLILLKFIFSIRKFSKKLELTAFDYFNDLFRDKITGFQLKIKNYELLDFVEKNLFKVLTDYLESVNNFSKEKTCNNTVRDYMEYVENIINNPFTEEIEESTKNIYENEGIRIISFYESKNFEFEAVFIPFLNRGYSPSVFSKPQTYDSEIFHRFIEKKYPGEEELKKIHIEEERKILNMGISRAKNYLYITSNRYLGKSSFFEEISDDIKKIKEAMKNKSAACKKSGKKLSQNIEKKPDKDKAAVNYFRNKWILKKKAIVSVYRKEKNIFYDKAKFEEYHAFLKKVYNPSDWWNLRKPTINLLKPFDFYINTFSYSSIESYDSCPFKYKFEYLFKIKSAEQKYSLLSGSIYHEAVRRFLEESDNYEISDLLCILDEEIKRNKDKLKFEFLAEEIKEKGINDMQNFYINFVSGILPALKSNKFKKTIFCEKKFEFDFKDKYRINGKIDFIKAEDDHRVEILDFKSSQAKFSEKDLKEKIQLKIYKMASKYSKSLNQGQLKLSDKKISLKYYFLGREKDPYLIMPDDEYSEDILAEKISETISNIKDEIFIINPKNYMSCFYCNYKIFCGKYYGNSI